MNVSYLLSSPSSIGYYLIFTRPLLLIRGYLTCLDAYKVWVPFLPSVVRCLLATEFTTMPYSLTWCSDNNLIILFWLYTASCTQSNIGTFSADTVFNSAVTVGRLDDLMVCGSNYTRLTVLIVTLSILAIFLTTQESAPLLHMA